MPISATGISSRSPFLRHSPSAIDTAMIPKKAVKSARAVESPAPTSAAPGLSATQAIAGSSQIVAGETAPVSAVRERFVVTSDVLKLTFDTEGGSLIQTEYLKHRDLTDQTRNFVVLDQGKDRVYVAQTGLIAGASGGSFPTHKTVMAIKSSERELKDGSNELTVKFESPDVGGVRLTKTYTIKRGHYDLTVRHDVLNGGKDQVAPQLYFQLVRDGNKLAGESSFYSTFTGPAVYTEAKKYQQVKPSRVKINHLCPS